MKRFEYRKNTKDPERSGARAQVHPISVVARSANRFWSKRLWFVFVCLMAIHTALSASDESTVKVASKLFTESVVLGELMTLLVKSTGAEAVHLREFGTTHVVWKSLLRGEIDLYVDYSGTLTSEILSNENIETMEGLRQRLLEDGLLVTESLGFNNTYALSMKPAVAARYGITRISDLRHYPELRFGFTDGFMARNDGWQGLRQTYGLPQTDVRGLHHHLAYRGLDNGEIDLMDAYSTDGEIAYYKLRVLEDDLDYFPDYHPLIVYRVDLAERMPHVVAALQKMVGNISEEEIRRMNSAVTLGEVPESGVAADFLAEKFHIRSEISEETPSDALYRRTVEHLVLVSISLLAAIALSVPLGVLCFKYKRSGQIVLGAVGVIQTIPSLALLVFMIPLLGIGNSPAIAALFLYSLLPIVRNTYVGLDEIPPQLRESAQALGLPPLARLRLIELPLAYRSILAGIKTSAIINIGTATLGALVGAGGYGQPILTGVRLDDMGLILQGAVPAAILALLAQGIFEIAERWLVPRGLRVEAE
uniref:Osmoprotectant transport system permease protein n=1 Tax=Candidatus Kentrum sp. LFY TaxID=2126342 RepID=A0A450WVW1_9GAMM|nr:MAG: osmoprotectant transport system permease protein [Candidatus Kentron sp. LFY]